MRDIGLTVATEISVFAAGLLLVGLIGRTFGTVALSEYLLVRRVFASLQSGVLLGLGVAVARQTAYAGTSTCSRIGYFAAGSLSIMTVELGVAGTLFIGRTLFARWLFGSETMSYLILPLAALLVGLGAEACVYAYFRGTLKMVRANALQCCSYGLAPLALISLASGLRSISFFLTVQGLLSLSIAVVFALPLTKEVWHQRRSLQVYAKGRDLLRYGLGRVPGDFGTAALFTFGPLVAAHLAPIVQASGLLLGTSILMAVSMGSAPIGVVLLSKVSQMLAEGRVEEVRAQIIHLFGALVDCSWTASLQIFIFADSLVKFWVGSQPYGVETIRILCLAIPPYVLFTGMRSVVDAATPKAYNARNILVALGSYTGMIALGSYCFKAAFLDGIACALVIALWLLSVMTVSTVQKLYHVRLPLRSSLVALATAVALGGASALVRFRAGTMLSLSVLFWTEVVVGTAFLVSLWFRQSPWLAFALKMVVPSSAPLLAGPIKSR